MISPVKKEEDRSFLAPCLVMGITAKELLCVGKHYNYNTLIRCQQKQPFRGVLIKRCNENMQQIYRI